MTSIRGMSRYRAALVRSRMQTTVGAGLAALNFGPIAAPAAAMAAAMAPNASVLPGGCSRLIALTFDDGPDDRGSTATPAWGTSANLAALRAKGVRATFFLIGRKVTAASDLAATIVDEGHDVANHTMGHIDLTDLSTPEAISQIERGASVIREATGLSPTVGRPPFGYYNDSVIRAFRSQGIAPVDWAVDPKDWADNATVSGVHDAVVDGVLRTDSRLRGQRSAEGIVVLMHDVGVATAAALPLIIDDLRARGFGFGRLVPSKTVSSTNMGYVSVQPW